VLGAAVGLERELREHDAGLRTHMLVAVGSALFTIVSAFGFHDVLAESSPSLVRLDPSRIAAQIVTGIGFLGAGAIIRQGITVRGLTTAATLWVVAAIGMAAGAGSYLVAVFGTAAALFALSPLRFVARHTIDRMRPPSDRLLIELRAGEPLAALLDEVPNLRAIEVSDEAGRRVVALQSPDAGETLVARLSDLDCVVGVRWQR